MNEKLLQYIWQFQYFNKAELLTEEGEPVVILQPGQINTNQGPDFSDARIRIGDTTWVGNVELHLKTSDWRRHQHQTDENYNNVILHVVWQHDTELLNGIPVLDLCQRIPRILLDKYEKLMNSAAFIPCENSMAKVPSIQWTSWKARLLAERLMRKSNGILSYLEQNRFHWEESLWWLLARGFGMKLNGDLFESVARSLPLSLLARHKSQPLVLEALLQGQGGLLEGSFEDDYPVMLRKEYLYYSKKYRLNPVHGKPAFLRMRPGNFPTLRLAQLAMIIHQSSSLFTQIKEEEELSRLKKSFDLAANDYWHYHYRFDEPSDFKIKKIGDEMIDHIIVNTICPLLFTYANYHNDEASRLKSIRWLEETAAENNSITREFANLGIHAGSAFDSQALLELKSRYCDQKKCLECGIGNALFNTLKF